MADSRSIGDFIAEEIPDTGDSTVLAGWKITNLGRSAWHPCDDAEPHGRHEWYSPAFRRDCPGVPSTG